MANIFEFELGEDVRDEDRLRQDEEWAEAIADGRGHVSHRELTMLNAPQFCLSIMNYRVIEQLVEALYGKTSILRKITPEILEMIVEYGIPGHGPLVNTCVVKRNITPRLFANNAENGCSMLNKSFPFRICVRKRPMDDYEKGTGAYDVCNTRTKNHITLHEGKLARNGRQLSMTHYQYVLDEVYGEAATNEEVCQRSVEPLLSWAVRGNQSSLLCFGQTGTGKTYTLYGALNYISHRLVGKTLRVTFYEVHGKKCYDLLSQRKQVHLRSDEHEVMHVRGARQVTLPRMARAKDLMAVLHDALELRSSEETERNPISSRSHAVCVVDIASAEHEVTVGAKAMSLADYLSSKAENGPPAAEHGDANKPRGDLFAGCGRITLVDLAGSERNYETVQMTAAQHKESADINFALMALKDCFRAYHTQLLATLGPAPTSLIPGYGTAHKDTSNGSSSSRPTPVVAPTDAALRIPYRSSLLTKVLKQCFALDSIHRTTIIATVSPTAVDLQHSLNSLAHVVLMSPTLNALTNKLSVEVPMVAGTALSTSPVSEWTAEQVNAWLAFAENGRFAQLVLPPGTTGMDLLSLDATNLAGLFSLQVKQSRRDKEGFAWVESADESSQQEGIANALWSAVRREQQSALVKQKIAKARAEADNR